MNRRHFLTAASAFATAPIFAATSPSRLRIGQIGTGHAHASGKMAAMRSLPALWEVVGVAESDAARRAGLAKTEAYAGISLLSEEALLATPNLKAVAVETRIEESAATAMRCLKAGKHIHLDKPGALNLEDYKTLRLGAEKDGLTVQMGYMLRYNPAFELLFKAIREGWLGEITEIDAAMGKLADSGTRKNIGSLPGGGMFELGCHLIDAVLTILGKPTAVQAFSTPTQPDGVKDNQVAILQYPKAIALIRCNHADPFGGPRRRFNVTGTEGTFEILPLESGKINLSLTKPAGGYKKGTQTFQLDVPKGRYDAEFVDLAKVIQEQTKLAWDAAHDIAVYETVMRAAGL